MKIKLLSISAALMLSGCASSPSQDYSNVHPEIMTYCSNVSSLYGQVHDLKEMEASRMQAAAFMFRNIEQGDIDKESRKDIGIHTKMAITSIYDSPKIKRKEWTKGIMAQCVDKPGVM